MTAVRNDRLALDRLARDETCELVWIPTAETDAGDSGLAENALGRVATGRQLYGGDLAGRKDEGTPAR
jgi:hypothetical protein